MPCDRIMAIRLIGFFMCTNFLLSGYNQSVLYLLTIFPWIQITLKKLWPSKYYLTRTESTNGEKNMDGGFDSWHNTCMHINEFMPEFNA